MKRLVTKLLLIGVVFLSLQTEVNAYFEIDFVAQIGPWQEIHDPYNLLKGSISAGDIISAKLWWNPDIQDPNPYSIGYPMGFTVWAGGSIYEASTVEGYAHLGFVNDDPQHGDYIHPVVFNNAPMEDTYTRMIYIWAQNWSQPDTIITKSLQDLAPSDKWDTIYLVIAGRNPYDDHQNYDFRAHILTANVSSIPIPGSLMLLVSGLASLWGTQKFAKRRRRWTSQPFTMDT